MKNSVRRGRDFALIYHVNLHYQDLVEDIAGIDSLEAFTNSGNKRRAILFDFLEIGELVAQLSKAFLKDFGNPHSLELISIRNRIVHGYGTIKDGIVFETLKTDLPKFIEDLNAYALSRYRIGLETTLGQNVTVIIDRPMGYNHEGLVYPVNYGYIADLTALDGEFQDAYVIGIDKAVKEIDGKVVAIIEREDDIEDKLVVAPQDLSPSDDEIEEMVRFQEQYFIHKILRKSKQ